ncbi:MAG: heavy metal translocating P-type ATPase [Caldilineaceae bacterium]|nr:heavy metal translocating P-type ATPase [Caldilineaceae bacterium]
MTESTNTFQFQVTGMDCAGCAKSVENAVGQMVGVQQCSLNFTTAKLSVTGAVSATAITDKVRSLGYTAAPVASTPAAVTAPEPLPNFWSYLWQRAETRFALAGLFFILPGLIWSELLGREALAVDLLSVLALVAAGWPVAISAWRAVLNRDININVLMTIAAIGAVVIGAYTEAGMVMVLFALSEALEGYIGNRARHAIRSLLAAAPSDATLIARNGLPVPTQQVAITTLQIGDRIRVRPGERIPMDGRVITGYSAVNQAAITGESMPLDKQPGDDLFAGSINGEGVLELEVTHIAADNTISRMIRLVEEAQEQRAPVQRFVDLFARYYTPAVVVLAALVATLPPLLWQQPFWNPDPETFGWFYRGLALLVVACPCALVISTPVSLISAITNAARHGVLFKGGAFLEALSQVRAVALDKTGTITAGTPAVVAVRSLGCATMVAQGSDDCTDCDDLLALASAVEVQSEHPLARAVVNASKARGLDQRYAPAAGVTALTGRGVTGTVAGRQVTIGSHAYFDATIGHDTTHCTAASADAQRGYTPILVSVDGTYQGAIAVADTVRESSRMAVEELKAAGIEAVVMLTGDNQGAAQTIGSQVAVTDVRAELLPADKLTAIRELQTTHGSVAMVGDGINDAPALAAANVGIAIGGATGTAQAMETADITLMSADLRRLPFAVRLSRQAMRTIRTNVALSIGIKLVFLLMVLLGWGTMWMAVLADMGTALLVTFNGMRLLGFGGKIEAA